ncbi:D-2-hydroxyacid dehydrogenase [Terrihabitans rhizophilus]|uniref:D-2-hydroxyacid dehydrogenase n=1 Tax=Terrihabitans rhizophilus TaxID=3092662 RepID=A0ABU4RIN3_9HYPH|nr:D-2-hydroxyacid dehydrogenase [Terrihabitans sp. PJ23]MDX6804696.1 D-2-hydroxyacid dehydrogenase [Terrihabitans sp. PJ23]
MAVTAKLRVHIQEYDGPNEVFRINAAKYGRHSAGDPEIAERLDVSFGRSEDDLRAGLVDAEVLVCGHLHHADLKAGAPRLRWVQSIFAGVDELIPLLSDVVTLTNGSGLHAQKAGEYGMGAILMLNSAVPHFIEAQRARQWTQIYTPTVRGRTVLILGTGRLGGAIARFAQQFGMNVIGVARTAGARPDFPNCHGVGELHDLLPRADFLVLIVPNTPATTGLIGRAELDLLPAHAGIVSLGRSQVMDHAALIAKLEANELGGAFLDVFDQEPLPPDDPLWSVPRVVISPHCTLDDGPGYVALALDLFFANARRYRAGEPLHNVIDQRRGY